MLLDDLIEYAMQISNHQKVVDVRVGVSFTCVCLEDNNCGLGYTFRNELGSGCGVFDEAGTLIGKKCEELFSWAKSENRIAAAIGVATLNAVINSAQTNWEKGNVVTMFDVKPSDTFGMIGGFGPILKEIEGKTDNIYVFEKNISQGSNFFPEESIPEHLPKCNIVVITSTSIINHSIDGILEHCKNAETVCMVGPSTPLCTEVFKKRGIQLMAGSVVTNPSRALEIVSQGGGTRALKPTCDQVLVRV